MNKEVRKIKMVKREIQFVISFNGKILVSTSSLNGDINLPFIQDIQLQQATNSLIFNKPMNGMIANHNRRYEHSIAKYAMDVFTGYNMEYNLVFSPKRHIVVNRYFGEKERYEKYVSVSRSFYHVSFINPLVCSGWYNEFQCNTLSLVDLRDGIFGLTNRIGATNDKYYTRENELFNIEKYIDRNLLLESMISELNDFFPV